MNNSKLFNGSLYTNTSTPDSYIEYLQQKQKTPQTTNKTVSLQPIQYISVQELFKKFRSAQLKSVKNKTPQYVEHWNKLFSQMELFDFSMIETDKQYSFVALEEGIEDDDYYRQIQAEKINLPFETCFIKMDQSKYGCFGLYLKESTPEGICGGLFISVHIRTGEEHFLIPFNIHNIDNPTLYVDKKQADFFNERSPWDIQTCYRQIIWTLGVIYELNQHATLVDHLTKTEYYKFNNSPTIRIKNRPIYYILDKKQYEKRQYNIKPVTKLEYSHAFKVRGHWRKISETSIGKDRSGQYTVKGSTWVIDYIKGTGDLIQKVRVVK